MSFALHPVALVGAGPGPLDLLTVRALRLIQEADVVIHDHLVGAEVLAAVRPGAQLIFVGKRAGQFCRPQVEIEELLVKHGRSGRKVVRLKGGDPLIFGRGGEEAATLAAAGLSYEIVPGVTAALAAGAATGIPLTHRDHSSAVVFLTGHENPEKAGSAVPWESYGRLDATLCVYMGVKNLASILQRLQDGGMKPETPAALVQSAASAEQRTLVATVGTLAAEAARQKFGSPALVIIGSVAGGTRRAAYALIDNGSLAPASALNLRRVAAELSQLTAQCVTAVSWKHSDRIPAEQLGGQPAWTIGPWIRHERARGATDFRFIPFFISPQGAIGSALRRDLDALTAEHGGSVSFTLGLGAAIPTIVASRIEAVLAEQVLDARGRARSPDTLSQLAAPIAAAAPAVIVVDHGGPSAESAALRDQYAAEIARQLGRSVIAASMESPDGDSFGFNRPLLAEALAALPAHVTDVVIAPLFLSPGRHAGPAGDLARIAAAAARPGRRHHFAALVGTHPLAVASLATAIEPRFVRPYALV
jgi:uroporphyrin-III C-methyltransferase